jgi:hypothetical protein
MSFCKLAKTPIVTKLKRRLGDFPSSFILIEMQAINTFKKSIFKLKEPIKYLLMSQREIPTIFLAKRVLSKSRNILSQKVEISEQK